MIAFIKGTVIELESNPSLTAHVVVDVKGVGYELLLTKSLAQKIDIGNEYSFTVYTEVKEDAIRLYGFVDKLEKQTFLLLNEVKGIGPKSAIEVLSKVSAKDLLSIIAFGDLARLKSVKGIGQKTAERVVVELKEKVTRFVYDRSSVEVTVNSKSSNADELLFTDAELALIALGFSKKDSQKVLNDIKSIDSLGVQLKDSGDIVREALKRL